MAEIPEHLLQRSAEARAKADGRPVEEILSEWRGEAPTTAPATPPAPETPTAATPASSGGVEIPEHLLQRSAEARAKADGRPVEEILSEWRGEAPTTAPATPPAPETPTAATQEAPVAPAPAPSGEARLPEHLLRRSAEARAKATGRPVEEILAELEASTPAAPSAPAPTAATAAPDTQEAGTGPAPTGGIEIPEHLLQRSAEARAKADGRPVEEILSEWRGEAPTTAPAPETPKSAPATGTKKLPEALLRRSAEAKAKATGRPVEEILAELQGDTPETPKPAPATGTKKLPEALLRRSAEAKAKATGRPVEEILAELQGDTPETPKPAPATGTKKLPEALLRRSAEAKAKATGRPVEEILAELQGDTPTTTPDTPAAEPIAVAPVAAPVTAPVAAPTGTDAITPPIRPFDHRFAIVLIACLVMAAAFLTIIGAFYQGFGEGSPTGVLVRGLTVTVGSVTVVIGALFFISYTNLDRRLTLLVTGAAFFGLTAIAGLLFSLYAPRSLCPSSITDPNALQIRLLPLGMMLGSLIVLAAFLVALDRYETSREESVPAGNG